MPRQIYSDDSLRSRKSVDSQQYLGHTFTRKNTNRLPKDVQRESLNLPKKMNHRTQIDYPIDQNDSDRRLHWETTDYDWTTRTLLQKFQKITKYCDKSTQKSSKSFAEIHRGMDPYSEDPIARTELPYQSESKSRGCMGCFRRRRIKNMNLKKQTRKCFRLCRRKKKQLSTEERKILQNTNMDDMFVPLQKSTGTSATTVRPSEPKIPITQDKTHKKHKKSEKSASHRKKDISESEKSKAPATIKPSTIKLETEQIPITKSLINDEKYRPAMKSDFTKSCCYLCVENTARIAMASNNVERRHKAVEALLVDKNGGSLKKHDKTCNPTPCVRSIHSSVKMSTCDESTSCTQLSPGPKTKEKQRSKKNGILGRPDFCRLPSDEHSDTCNVDKCRKPNPELLCRTKKKRGN